MDEIQHKENIEMLKAIHKEMREVKVLLHKILEQQ